MGPWIYLTQDAISATLITGYSSKDADLGGHSSYLASISHSGIHIAKHMAETDGCIAWLLLGKLDLG